MTTKEALVAAVLLPVDSKLIDKALIDADINPLTPYTKSLQLNINEAAIEVLLAASSTKSIQQGGFTFTTDLAAINARIQQLARLTGRTDLLPAVVETPKPTIRNVSHLW